MMIRMCVFLNDTMQQRIAKIRKDNPANTIALISQKKAAPLQYSSSKS